MAEKKKFNFFLAGMSLFFLVVLPAISWYYLTMGRDWRRAVVAELSEYGTIPPLIRSNARGLDYNLLQNSVCVVYATCDTIYTQADSIAIDVFTRLFSQFQAKDNFKLIVLRPDRHPISAKLLDANTTKSLNWIEISPSDTLWLPAFQKNLDSYNVKKSADKPLTINGTFALSDIQGTIRRYYSIADIEQQKRLVEHIAILLPN